MESYKEFINSIDKYQRFFLDKLAICVKRNRDNGGSKFDRIQSLIFQQEEYGKSDNGELCVIVHGKQNRSNLKEYIFPDFLTGVFVMYDGQSYEQLSMEYEDAQHNRVVGVQSAGENLILNCNSIQYCVPIDYTKPVKALKLTVKEGLADDIIIPVTLCEYGEERNRRDLEERVKLQREQEERERLERLKNNVKLKVSTGKDLINVYFQPCSEDYAYTKIYLRREGDLLAKYQVEDGTYFHSVTGLAYGSYTVSVEQYDKNGNFLFRSEELKVSVSRPYSGGLGF